MENKIVSYVDLGECRISKDDLYLGKFNVVTVKFEDGSTETYTPNNKTEKKKLIRLIKNEIKK